MNKKLFYAIAGLVVLIASVYFQSHAGSKLGKVSGVQYDHSIKVAYGQPIKVIHVVDGDTIVLANGDNLRYIGIDTPEEVDPRKPVQCFAQEAADYNKQLVEGQTIKFFKDKTEKDQYGRWLGFVYLEDGTFVNDKLVQDGYAFAYPYKPDISKSATFAAGQDQARLANLGLWAACQVSKLSSGREQTNSIK